MDATTPHLVLRARRWGAQRTVEEIGPPVWTPMVPEPRRLSHKRRSEWVLAPAYPGWLFCPLLPSLPENLLPPRLVHMVGIVSSVQVAEILQMVEEQMSPETRPARPSLVVGMRVRVVSGWMRGRDAVVVSVSSLHVQVDAEWSTSVLSLPVGCVEPA